MAPRRRWQFLLSIHLAVALLGIGLFQAAPAGPARLLPFLCIVAGALGLYLTAPLLVRCPQCQAPLVSLGVRGSVLPDQCRRCGAGVR